MVYCQRKRSLEYKVTYFFENLGIEHIDITDDEQKQVYKIKFTLKT